MNVLPEVHPAEETLAAYGLGKADENTAAVVAKHLETCPICRSRVANLSSDSFVDRLQAAKASGSTSLPNNFTFTTVPTASSKPLVQTVPDELANCVQYEAIRKLGKGGMGTVYLARNKLLGRDEVLKVVNKSMLDRPGAVDRFLREIQSAARLQHPNVVTAYSAMRLGELLVFAMEYVPGQDLAQVVRNANRPVPVPNACYYVLQAAQGLQHAHEKGMVHRDIKPSNLILSKDGTKSLVKILDFGLAKLTSENKIDTSLTSEGRMLGTPDFMAPEQAMDASKADIRADIYSMGCTLFFLLAGRPPFAADSVLKLLQHHQSTAAPSLNGLRPDAPDELAAAVARMMAKEPRMRYQTPGEVIKALTPFLKRGTPTAPVQAGPVPSQLVDSGKKSHLSATPSLFPTLPVDFGRYRVLKLLGQGGMGAVYLADDSQLDRQVALKIPFFNAAESPQRVERFIREAKSAAILHHPNICTVFDAGQIDGKPFITMAYLAGTPLDHRLNSDQLLPPHQAAGIARNIASALAHAHGKGTVHRDLKPANVMIDVDGKPVVMDFGLAKRAAHMEANEGKLTRHGAVLGTPSYMSPEQVRGETETIGPATDIYSLGVILFEMLTSHTPYSGSMVEVMGQILAAPVPPVKELQSDVDPRLDAICRKAMAKDPKSRFQSMTEFQTALDQYLIEPPARIQPEPTVNVELELVAAAPKPVVEESPYDQPATPRARQSIPVKELDKKKTNEKATNARWKYPAGVVVLALVVFIAANVIKVKTPDGILVVEVNEPNAEVYVDGNQVTVTWDEGGKKAEIHIKPGADVQVKKDGITAHGEIVTLEDGKRWILSARLDRPAPAVGSGKEAKSPAKIPDQTKIQPSPALEALRRDQIPPEALALAGDGDPNKAPANLVGVLGQVVPIHYQPVLGLAFSPDGRWLASASEDKTIMLRDAATGDVKRILKGHTAAVAAVAFSKDSRTLLSSSSDGSLRLWPVEVEDKPAIVETKLGAKANQRLAVSHDGRYVAVGAETGLIKIWKWGEWDKPIEVPGVTGKARIRALALSPDGGLLAYGGDRDADEKEQKCRVRVVNLSDGSLKTTLVHPGGWVTALSFSHDGKYLASVGGQEQANGRVWEVASGKEVSVLVRHYLGGEVPVTYSVAWSPDDKLVAVSGHSRVAVHDPLTGSIQAVRWDFTAPCWLQLATPAVTFNPQGNLLAAGGYYGDAPVWDTTTWRRQYLERGHRQFVRSLAYNAEQSELLSVGEESALLRWRLNNTRTPVVHHLEYEYAVLPQDRLRFIGAGRDGKEAPLASVGTSVFNGIDGATAVLPWHAGIVVLNTQTGKQTINDTGPGRLGEPHLGDPAVAPNGHTLAVGRDRRVILWDLPSGKEVHRFPSEGDAWPALAFSRDGVLLSAYNDRAKLMMVWNTQTGNECCSWGVNTQTWVSAFNADGNVLATGQADGLVVLWETNTGKRIQSLTGHTARIRALKFTSDGKTLVSSSDDGTIRLWVPKNQRAREIIPLGPKNWPLIFDLDPSGKYLFAAGSTPVIFILRLPEARDSSEPFRSEDGIQPKKTLEPKASEVRKEEIANNLEPKAGEVRKFEIASGVFMEFCWIPGGEAQLGSPKTEQDYITKTFFDGKRPDWFDDETESKRGKFPTKGFWLGKYTVTQAEWKAVIGDNPSDFDGKKDNKAKGLETSRFPVDSVSWNRCQEFLAKVNQRPDVVKVFGIAGKFVLPHEDQWEYACRGGKGNKQAFYFGDGLNGTQANCYGDFPYKSVKGAYKERTTEVGSYEKDWPHPWGLCDMHGNVYQWCDNKYEQSNDYVLRGGAWRRSACDCRSAYRHRNAPDHSGNFRVGFRVCLSLTMVPAEKAEAPKIDPNPDRTAAEYVLSIGGVVRVNDEVDDIRSASELPRKAFRLTYVDLNNNRKVRNADLTAFDGCKNLTHLNLWATQVKDEGLAHFNNCKNLSSLNLAQMHLSDAGLANFKDCRSLTYLHLGGTKVGSGGMAHFKDCKNLLHLNLAGTQVSDPGLVN